jgi:hypothetical protein
MNVLIGAIGTLADVFLMVTGIKAIDSWMHRDE